MNENTRAKVIQFKIFLKIFLTPLAWIGGVLAALAVLCSGISGIFTYSVGGTAALSILHWGSMVVVAITILFGLLSLLYVWVSSAWTKAGKRMGVQNKRYER